MADYFRQLFRLACEDGATRSVRVRCYVYNGEMAPDTFFSVPADARIGGLYVTGFATTSDDGPLQFSLHNDALAKLRAKHGDEFANRFRTTPPKESV